MRKMFLAFMVFVCNCMAVIQLGDLNKLADYASKDGSSIKLTPGVYKMSDYLNDELIALRRSQALAMAKEQGKKRGDTYMFIFSGNDNNFDFTGVTIEVDTKFLSVFKSCYIREFYITGSGNTFTGLTITDIGDLPTYMGGNSVSIEGDNNTLKDITVNVRGSFPYGYGDYLGKGSESIVAGKKHSGVQICGINTKLIGCKVITSAFGHAFYIQGGINTILEDCYAKGQMRSTDDMLAETSGIAFDNGFKSVYKNYDGEQKIPAGYMKSLSECGFRTYASGGPTNRPTGKVTVINCTAQNMRVGFALAADDNTELVYISGCESIGCERGFFITKGILKNSRSDAVYGPMLYLEGSEASDIELTLTNLQSDFKVHALATISGKGHKLTLNQKADIDTNKKVPIMLGYGTPSAGEISSPIPEAAASDITLINNTDMPVISGADVKNCKVITNGIENVIDKK